MSALIPTEAEVYPSGRRFYVVHISDHAWDVISNHLDMMEAEEFKRAHIETVCPFARRHPEDIHIVEADGKDNLLEKMATIELRRESRSARLLKGQTTLEAWV